MSDSTVKPAVEYNWLSPNCGIKVSNICLGTMTFGNPSAGFSLPGNTDEANSHAILDRYYELGGNFLDTANIYTSGQSEEIIGTWMKKHDRSSIVLATKVRFGRRGLVMEGNHPHETGLARGTILANLDASLKRLQTDYIDLYYAHCWDAGVKLEETLRTFNDIVRSGKVRYIGVSNLTGAQLQKVATYNQFMGFNQIVTLQQEYSLLERNSDIEVVPTIRSEALSIVPYSPLKGGLLTGKFKRDDKDAAATLTGTRLGWTNEKPAERTWPATPYIEAYRNNEDFWTVLNTTETIAKEHGKTQTQVAIRWLLQKDFIPSVIIGAKSVQQLEDNMGAGTGWKLTDEQMKQLDDASKCFGRSPSYPYGFIEMMNATRIRP